MSEKLLQRELTACVFLHKDGKLFIAKRAATKEFLPNKYELIGGRLEFGETPITALIREAEEEIYIKIRVSRLYNSFTYLSENDTKHSIEVDYFAEMEDPSQEIRLNPEDHSESRWISEEEIDTYLPADDPETDAIRLGFQILRQFPNYAALP